MAVGAQDYIDRMLVAKYSTKQVDNHDGLMATMVDPNKMMDTMNDIAMIQRNMMSLSHKLDDICMQINSKVRYKNGQRFFSRVNG